MSVYLDFEIEGEKQFSRYLEVTNKKMNDMSSPFEKTGESLKEVFEGDVFSTKGAAVGTQWRPLSPVTIAQKARLGFPSDPLVRTGAMQRGFRALATSNQVAITNITTYFKYHQSNRPRRHIPRRVMMKLGDNQKELVQKIFQEHFLKSLK